MGLVHRRPQSIDGLVLFCPLIEPDENTRHMPPAELRKVDLDFFTTLDTAVQEGLRMGSGVVVVASDSFERGQRIYSPAYRVAISVFLNQIKAEGYKFSFDIYTLPEVYTRPSLILAGCQDSSVGFRDALKLESQLTRSTIVILDAAGHGLPLDQDSLFIGHMREWLERIDAFENDMTANQQ